MGSGNETGGFRGWPASDDTTPYKTHIGGYYERGPCIQLSRNGLACGAGYHRMVKDDVGPSDEPASDRR